MTLRAIVRTNEPGTCVYCGQRLVAWRKLDDFFCTGGCAEHFGRATARAGVRLKPYTERDAAAKNKRPPRRPRLPSDVCAVCTLTRGEHAATSTREGGSHDFVRRGDT